MTGPHLNRALDRLAFVIRALHVACYLAALYAVFFITGGMRK